MDRVPVPQKQAMMMVSNMHIIPANPQIAKQITQVKRGDLARLKGDLVEVKDKDLVWTSSLPPTDTGDGACEVFRVSSIQWIEKVQRLNFDCIEIVLKSVCIQIQGKII